MKPPTAFREAIKATMSGACTVLLSTGLSCVFAVAIETSAHRLQYKFFPHWYDGKVKYALGLPHLQYQKLDSESSRIHVSNSAVSIPAAHDGLEALNFESSSNIQNDDNIPTEIPNDIPTWKQDEIMLASDNTQSIFQSYSDKLQEKAQLLSPERVSKILLTTAMTG